MKQFDNIKKLVQQAEYVKYHETAEECLQEMCKFSLADLAEEWVELEMDYAALIEVAKDWIKIKEGN